MQQLGTSPARLVDNVISLCGGASPAVAPIALRVVADDAPTYRLPFVEKPVRRDDLFDANGENPIFLRPADVENLYGIPASTVYDWIAEQPLTGFPAVKIAVTDESKRRLVLIPKRLFDEWLIGKSNLQRTTKSDAFTAKDAKIAKKDIQLGTSPKNAASTTTSFTAKDAKIAKKGIK